MASLDSRIPLAFQAPQINSPAQNKLAALAVRGAEMDLDQRGQALQQRNALMELAQRPDFYNSAGGINPAMMPEIGRVAPDRALDYSKAIQGQQKALSDAQMAQLNQAKTQLELVGRLVGGVTDEASFQAARQQAQAYGIPLDGVPAQYDPNWVQQTRQQTLTAQQQIDNFYKEQGLDLQQQRLSLDREKMGSEASKPVGAPMEVTGPNGAPTLVQRYADGSLRPVEGFAPKARSGFTVQTNPDGTTTIVQGGGGGLPANVLKSEQEDLEAIGAVAGLNADLAAVIGQIESGDLSLGPVSNMLGQARNAVGLSNQGSRNLASFQATLERLRNESLRLNKGVQTEGDAVRAWNELLSNINDPAVVTQRLQEVRSLNDRAIQLRQAGINSRRANFGLGPLDTSNFQNVPAALGSGQGSVSPGQQQGMPQGSQQRSITRTGRDARGRRVAQYSDGTIDYLE